MRGHQGDGHISFVLIGIGYQCGMIDEVTQAFRTLLVIINSGVDQFLEILQPTFRFIVVLGFESVFIAGVEDGGFDQVRHRRRGFVILGCVTLDVLGGLFVRRHDSLDLARQTVNDALEIG
jgi:hypothetical protein